jgi:hypothetical protein
MMRRLRKELVTVLTVIVAMINQRECTGIKQVHHVGWMVSGQETLFHGIPLPNKP